ncbi:putative flavoprotein involved in K+ transport [Saccharopolyspora kobensis]|uniref:Flavoprotein involved in K+ transport n=1 Tax=Saccharopolyspora kobensis TaxID=146035 RepID=A0A1H6DSI1_9PSEU|nr:NAD(P)/FAD-dependent oxidoreductase [Saccharopolyspora kobensis]SEG88317.1 putative flavoprotein involved in K+ transport [Saccharopolyspora kobensis]SFE01741.1 putative flavoprotein involved in K+ transport [Saccharopolyspora kobensis]
MSDHDAIVIGGGQSGLAAAHALRARGLRPLLLEAGPEPVGSWPNYYDSLTLFSPARFSAFPGVPFPGDPDRYPHRDEVIDYLRRYAATLDVDIRTGHRVETVTATNGTHTAHTAHGDTFVAPVLIAATGGFSRPHRPMLPGHFTGNVLHTAEYREPSAFAGQRVVIVGGGNSAVQIAVELAGHARTTIASRAPLRFAKPTLLGKDLHWWTATTRLDVLPIGPWLRTPPTTPISDKGAYRAAVQAGSPDRRDMFTHLDGTTVTWADGTRETVDTLILATGYRPDVSYLQGLGALNAAGAPQHRRGVSTTCPRLGYVGLEWQTSFSSATLRGVHRDAQYVTSHLAEAARTRCCSPINA